MPGKLIAFIATLLIIVTFIGFNIENSSDIRIWFGEKGILEDVPIFVSFFVMYLVGVISVIPFLMGWHRKQNRKDTEELSEETGEKPAGKQKNVRVLGGRRKKEKAPEAEMPPEEDNSGDTDSGSGEIPPEENN